jgi:hypothetical protein
MVPIGSCTSSHQQIAYVQLVLGQQLSHRDAAKVHVRLRLGEENFFSGQFAAAHERLAFGTLNADRCAIREFVHGHETQVMRRPLILGIGVA